MNESVNPAPEAEPKEKKKKEAPSLRRDIYDWMQCIVVAIIVCVLLFSFAVRLVDVVGDQHEPHARRRRQDNRLQPVLRPEARRHHRFPQGRVPCEPLVKRIIAVRARPWT